MHARAPLEFAHLRREAIMGQERCPNACACNSRTSRSVVGNSLHSRMTSSVSSGPVADSRRVMNWSISSESAICGLSCWSESKSIVVPNAVSSSKATLVLRAPVLMRRSKKSACAKVSARPVHLSTCSVAAFAPSRTAARSHLHTSTISVSTRACTSMRVSVQCSICTLITESSGASVSLQPLHPLMISTGSSGIPSSVGVIVRSTSLKSHSLNGFARLGPSSSPARRALASLSSSCLLLGSARLKPSRSAGATSGAGSEARSRSHTPGTALCSVITSVAAPPSLSTTHSDSPVTITAESSSEAGSGDVPASSSASFIVRAEKEHFTDAEDAPSGTLMVTSCSVRSQV
ncbi:hypothetical protein Ctob_002902 [Chrysochromulina tobinii]|uniref:Uncharacterized protein n=1 Tax=Chrysochromulina tobinii TaxID=1460289 RepID=A0A0M0JJ08_9EUKA|nr:hypothetical protein Ctob_002902 [Chrysochromulina tobinii]|eukprot:KOO26228.1 hypothetical protein Ctob_002902 [Chrysochromulina sp. CCMP291]